MLRLMGGTAAALIAFAASAQTNALQPTQVNVTNDPTHRWAESEIVVNPRNPDNLVMVTTRSQFTYACQAGGAQQCRLVTAKSGYAQPYGLLNDAPGFTKVVPFVSFDRGKSWKPIDLPFASAGHAELVESGHPTLTAGPDGVFHAAWDTMRFLDTPTTPVSHGAVVTSSSHDGGRSWSTPVIAGTPVDHPFIAADLSGGTVYIASGNPSPMGTMSSADPKAVSGTVIDRFVVSSTNGARWSAPRTFDGYKSGSGGSGRFLAASHGVVASSWRTAGADCGDAAKCVLFQISADGGAHWSRHILPVPATYSSGPLMAADPSRAGHFAIGLMVNRDTEFQVYRTSDFGKTWEAPTTITEDGRKAHYHGWLAYSRSGTLGIMWRTRDQTPEELAAKPRGTAPYNVWAAISDDGGARFTAPLRVSSVTSPAPDSSPFAADTLSSMALGPDTAFFAWGDWRTGEAGIFFSAVKFEAFRKSIR